MGLVVVGSSGGTVLRRALASGLVEKSAISMIICDRPCGLLDIANDYNIESFLWAPTSKCNSLSVFLAEVVDRLDPHFFLSFYGKLFREPFLSRVPDRIINLHPAPLPEFPGLKGFEDCYNSKSKCLGVTAHYVDSGIDTGSLVSYILFKRARSGTSSQARHLASLIQTVQISQIIRCVQKGMKLKPISVCFTNRMNFSASDFYCNPRFDSDLTDLVGLCVKRYLTNQEFPLLDQGLMPKEL